ncbi:MAG: PilZ domain-containing protein [Candidatus Omnitrophica bacterium]|nr:PilZ domain-containing protein [Candidatus Omnitrophota bacterium]
MTKPGQERRRYLRVKTPLKIRLINKNNVICQTTTKDITPHGLRLEIKDEGININDETELKIEIPNTPSPIHAKAKVVWKKKLSSEDGAPYNIGCEFTKIEEDNKNTFLKFFCDLLYEKGEEKGEKGE